MSEKPWWKSARNLFFQVQPGFVNLGALGGDQSITQTFAQLFNNSTTLPVFFNNLFKTAIAVGAMLAVLRLGQAGFYYMMSDVWTNKQKAREILQQTVLGLLLLLSVWLILNQINPDILNLNILLSNQQGTQ